VGRFIHPAVGRVWFHDRVLAHLQIVAGLKLRRREGFFMSWHDADEPGSVRTTVWIDPSIAIGFIFEEDAAPSINRSWLEALTASSNGATGLQLTDEVRSELRGDTPDRYTETAP
jgi:hypothetical protein